jgi:hypothetical protein
LSAIKVDLFIMGTSPTAMSKCGNAGNAERLGMEAG